MVNRLIRFIRNVRYIRVSSVDYLTATFHAVRLVAVLSR